MNSLFTFQLYLCFVCGFSVQGLYWQTHFKHNVVTQRTKEGDDEMVGDNKQTSLNTNGRK